MPERRCEGCARQQELGCDAEPTDEVDEYGRVIWKNGSWVPLEIGGEEVWRCPRRPIKDDPKFWSQLLFFYGHYRRNGLLPDAGGLMDQSHRTMQTFAIMDDIYADCMKAKAEQERAERKSPVRALWGSEAHRGA